MRRWRLPVVGALMAWALLMVAVTVGARLPTALRLGSLPGSPRWEALSVPTGGLAPIDAAYVARVLGGPEVAFDRVSDASASAAASRSMSADRIVVDHGLLNDRRGEAYAVPGVPFTARSDIRAATREPNDPADCNANGGTVWYAYTADRDQRLLASTTGSDFAVALAVYEDSGRALGCEVDGSGNAQVPLRTVAGERYLFQVTGPLGGGHLVFNLDVIGGIRLLAERRGLVHLSPSISDDGRLVAFSNQVLNLTTGASVVIRARDGRPASGVYNPRISGDGSRVVFSSIADDLVAGDSNGYEDVFVYDIATDTIARISVSSTGQQGSLGALHAIAPDDSFEYSHQSQALSRDGRHAVFTSALAGLVPGDGEPCATSTFGHHYWVPRQPRHSVAVEAPGIRCRDVFVRDVARGTTARISQASTGEGADGDSGGVDISADGRFVAFASDASNLVAGDGNVYRDVFVHDRDADDDSVFDEPGATSLELISRAANGGPADGSSAPYVWPRNVSMSDDGRWIAFVSEAENLVPGDGDGVVDIFVHDRHTGVTTLVPAALGPLPTESPLSGQLYPQIDLSGDGRYLAFDHPAIDAADVGARADRCTLNATGHRSVSLHDRVSRSTVLLSTPPDGSRANGASTIAAVSGDGRYVAFQSQATNLDTDHEYPCRDNPIAADYPTWVFLYERPSRA